jgi:ABC-type nitrate/sulfonate/bicarbonate transport system ATPase subunit
MMVTNIKMEIKNLTKKYAEKTVISNFSLTLPEKGTICLFGPSGCGKTTLLDCIAGLERFDSGTISMKPCGKISYLFQEDRLLEWISAKENVSSVLHGFAKQSAEVAASWLRLVGLDKEDEDKLPSQLSGGMRQRVALARALAFGGGLFLLDEPFHALDSESKTQVIALIKEKAQESLKILVTHDLREAEQLADVILVLDGPPLQIVDTITK